MKSTWLLTVAVIFVSACPISAWGAFTVSGQVSPINPATWTSSTTGYIGRVLNRPGRLTVDGGSDLLSYLGYLGYDSASGGWVTVIGAGSTWTNSTSLYVGNFGTGTLAVQNGGMISNTVGYLGYASGSSGTATVTGAGSTWTNSSSLRIGDSGTGTLAVQNGGMISNTVGYLGYASGSSGTATVTGAGSTWTSSSSLIVGNSGTGILTVADGGKVTATSVSISSPSTVNLRVGGSGMLVLGSASTTGSISNSGKINLYADAFLAAGTYSPITEYAARTMTWSGTGTCNATGGAWDSTAKTFTVAEATALAAGATHSVSAGGRLLITDSASGKRVGASFAGVPGGTTFSASLLSVSELSGLALVADGPVLSAWYTNFTGGEVLLSFDIGLGISDLEIWYSGGGPLWNPYAPSDMIYDSHGITSFTVTGFNRYAVTGMVAGDANNDGVVDAADYIALKQNFGLGSDATRPQGDLNKDGAVNWADLQILMSNFGTRTLPTLAPTATPEPATLGLLAIGVLAIIRHKRK